MPEPLLDIPVQLEGLMDAQNELVTFAEQSTAHFDELSGAVTRLMQSQDQLLQQLKAQIQVESTEVWKVRQGEIEETKQKLAELRQEAEATGDSLKTTGGGVMEWISKAPGGLMSKMPGSTLMQGGLIGLLLYGFSELGRIETEANRLGQVFEASSNKAVVGTRGVAESFRHLEEESLVAREQMRGVVEQFARVGMSSEELTHHIHDVKENIAAAAMAFDAFLERPMGASAKDMIQLMDRYKLSSKELIETYGGITMAARESGIGTERFMAAVFDSSRALKTYGIDIKSISGLLLDMLKSAENVNMGVEASLTGAVGLAQGVSRLPTSWQAVIGQELAGGDVSALVGLMQFQQGFMKAGGGNQEDLARILQIMVSKLEVAIPSGLTGEDLKAARFQAYKQVFNLSPESASMLAGMTDRLLGKGMAGLGADLKMTAQEQKQLGTELLSEAQRQTNWQQATKLIMGGIGDVAMAILDILATGIGSFMAFVAYVQGWIERDPTQRLQSSVALQAYADRISGSTSDMMAGIKKIARGTGAFGSSSPFEPIVRSGDILRQGMERRLASAEGRGTPTGAMRGFMNEMYTLISTGKPVPDPRWRDTDWGGFLFGGAGGPASNIPRGAGTLFTGDQSSNQATASGEFIIVKIPVSEITAAQAAQQSQTEPE